MVGATVFLLLALAWGGRQHAWDSPVILGLFSASVVLGALFLAWQKRASEPLLPISILRNRIIVVTSIGAILITMVNMALSIYLPLYLQLCRAKTVGQAGVLLTAPLFGVVGGVPVGAIHAFHRQVQAVAAGGPGRGDGRVPGACGGGGHACPGCRRWPFLPAGRGHRREPAAHDGGIAELGAGGRYRHRHRRAHLFRAVGGAIGVAVFSAVVLHMLGPLGSQLETAHAAQGTVAGDAAAQEAVHAFSVFFGACALTLALAWAALTRLPVIPFRKTAARFERAEPESGVQADAG